jgi:glycosyltransferase involved in cell wall biosynthesis
MVIVQPSERLRQMGKSILCYIGCLNPQDGLDFLLRALVHLTFDLKRTDYHCVIMGRGDSLEDLRVMSRELRLEDYVEFTGHISGPELGANLSAADICLDPDPSSPLNDASTFIKIMEYMAYGKPIVSFDLKETRYSAQEAAIYVEPNNEQRFALAIALLMDDPALRARKGAFGRIRVERELQWSCVGKSLAGAYRALSTPAVPYHESSVRKSEI